MIDARYARFVTSIEPPLTEQQRRDIINSGKTPRARTPKAGAVLTESEKQIRRARARAHKMSAARVNGG